MMDSCPESTNSLRLIRGTFSEDNYVSEYVVVVWLSISGIVSLVATLGLSYLAGFHLLLASKGMSTLEFLNEMYPEKIAGYADQIKADAGAGCTELEMEQLPPPGSLFALCPDIALCYFPSSLTQFSHCRRAPTNARGMANVASQHSCRDGLTRCR